MRPCSATLGFAVKLPKVDPTSNAATLHYTMGTLLFAPARDSRRFRGSAAAWREKGSATGVSAGYRVCLNGALNRRQHPAVLRTDLRRR
jgi:hypothetical protein